MILDGFVARYQTLQLPRNDYLGRLLVNFLDRMIFKLGRLSLCCRRQSQQVTYWLSPSVSVPTAVRLSCWLSLSLCDLLDLRSLTGLRLVLAAVH